MSKRTQLEEYFSQSLEVDLLLRLCPDAVSYTHLSAEREFDLARQLVDEMKALGMEDAHVDEHCYVYGLSLIHSSVERRAKKGSNFSIIAVAEGAINCEEAGMKRKDCLLYTSRCV